MQALAWFCHFSLWYTTRRIPAGQLLSPNHVILYLNVPAMKTQRHPQCHWGSLVPAAELLAVNNELVSVSLLFPCKQARHHFYPLVEHMNQSFVRVPWYCACLQKLSGFLPGRLLCWAVVLQMRKKNYARFSHVSTLNSKAVKGDSCFLTWYLVLVILILRYMPCQT